MTERLVATAAEAGPGQSPPADRIPVMVPYLGEEEARAAADAVRSGWVAQGPRVAEFERAFAARIGVAHGVALGSCTSALHLALVACGIGPGDAVVVPSFSFIATANAVRYVGAEPVFADVDPATGNLTPETIAEVLTPRTRAVLLVHQGGVPADARAVAESVRSRGVVVIEDAACAAGSTAYGAPVGAEALIAAWSFHPRKVLTTGEGGMLTLDRSHWAARLRRLREHGMDVSAADRHASAGPVFEHYLETGYNYRMTDIQAAIGLVQLGRLDAMVRRRRELAAHYHELLGGAPGVHPVRDPAYGRGNYQSFWVLLDAEFPGGRDTALARLSAAGVSARRGIMAAHLEPAYRDVGHVPLPVTERLTRDSLILPLFHTMNAGQQRRVVDALLEPVR
ncbi:MAG TPA: DegT/DnrJ/EryC1/StrS family aminotransferase [Actinospica sp.]|jgi:perosamine synthetase|nr:DegT/DnrJ/EryC1/StrS family aminotransferase [Actinospica sp.]